MLKFNKHNVTNTATKAKARVYYSLDNRGDNKKCVTLYAKDYGDGLDKLFPKEVKNDTEIISDYIEKSRVYLFEDHPLYQTARTFVEEAQNA